jgi:hypothetical protein
LRQRRHAPVAIEHIEKRLIRLEGKVTEREVDEVIE